MTNSKSLLDLGSWRTLCCWFWLNTCLLMIPIIWTSSRSNASAVVVITTDISSSGSIAGSLSAASVFPAVTISTIVPRSILPFTARTLTGEAFPNVSPVLGYNFPAAWFLLCLRISVSKNVAALGGSLPLLIPKVRWILLHKRWYLSMKTWRTTGGMSSVTTTRTAIPNNTSWSTSRVGLYSSMILSPIPSEKLNVVFQFNQLMIGRKIYNVT